MKTNVKVAYPPERTAGGAVAVRINSEQQLRRMVMSCMLFEDEFYFDGKTIATAIAETIASVRPEAVAAMAVEAREKMKLRHIPLFIVREMARLSEHKKLVAETLSRVIQRADELSEFVSLYQKSGKDQPLSAQVKKGLAAAFRKFSEYDLAKYDRDGAVKLRDVLFLVHPKPKDGEQQKLWDRLADKKLVTPDTWEVELSASKDKKASWERLIAEKKLGALALIRNLRNIKEAGIEDEKVRTALSLIKTDRVLPFRFISAARHAEQFEPELEEAMFKCLQGKEKLPGKTILIIDVSGSMRFGGTVSKRSDLSRLDAAAALAMLVREVSEHPYIYATAGSDMARIHNTELCAPRRGFALSEHIIKEKMSKLGGGGIFLKQCMDYVFDKEKYADRVIVLTDEVDCDTKCNPASANAFGKHNYLINVASAKQGIGYGKWTHIDGWSEAAVDYILESEKSLN
jgi:60 kDa SS-A/Ro ribonucleoprotein